MSDLILLQVVYHNGEEEKKQEGGLNGIYTNLFVDHGILLNDPQCCPLSSDRKHSRAVKGISVCFSYTGQIGDCKDSLHADNGTGT